MRTRILFAALAIGETLAVSVTGLPNAAAYPQVFTEYTIPTAGSAPSGITAGPDGALWFTESAGNKIGRITTSGTITELTVPTAASNPTGIAAGPDGNLWFTERDANKIDG
jgi:virginiamycin B lyase